jgi:pentatricopeptide repeat protein
MLDREKSAQGVCVLPAMASEQEQPTIAIAEEAPAALLVGVAAEVAPEPMVEQSVREALHCALSLAQGNDADEAVEVLRCECAKAPADLLGTAYHAVFEAYLRSDRIEHAFDLLTELQQLGAERCVVSAASQEIVLRSLVQAQQHARASELLRSMCASNAAPGDAVFNSVVDAAVRARAYGEAWDVLELLLAHQRRADKYFVSILTKSLESSNDKKWVRRGINLVDRFIEQQKEDVDEIVFNSLLNVLGHVGDMLKLQQTLNKMSDYNVPPSAVTYGTVVKAYGRSRDIDAVLKVWQDMRNRCLGVNPVTCGCVLDACVKCGHLDKAMAIFQEMRLQGLHKNTVLYATLIKGLAKVRDLMGAIHLYQEMRMESVPCNLVTFNSLMDVCVRCGDLHMAALFLQDMINMGIEPDLITFSTLIKGYSHTGEVHKALALCKELKQRGLKCDEIMYNSLIDGCAKANKLHEGLLVFDDMLQSRVPPSNITFSILVKLQFEAGHIQEAFRLVDDMAGKYRCVPSRIVYTVLLRCCGQQGGPALARGAAMLTELAGKRNSKLPDQGMVSAVIAGCVQHSDFDLASRVVREFAAAGGAKRGNTGLVPTDSLRSLFEALGSNAEAQGIDLLEFLRRRALPNAQIAQLQAALNDGKRRGPTTTGANGGAAALSQTNMDSYAQWQGSNVSYTGQAYPGECFQQYQNQLGFQQQMGQMAYYGGYQTAQLPPYQGALPAHFQQQQSQLSAAPSPVFPTMPAQSHGIVGTGSLLPTASQTEFLPSLPQTPGLVQPSASFPVSGQPEVAVAVAPGLVPPPPPPLAAPAPVPTATAKSTTTKTAKARQGSSRRIADKENAAPAPPQAKEAPILGQIQARLV